MIKLTGQIAPVQLRGKINAIPGGAAKPKLQSKIVEITENGIKDVFADSGYDALESVTIFTEVPGADVPEWDGSYTVTDAVELITFVLDGDIWEAEEGMTWGEWVASDYNTGGYSVYSGGANMYITIGSGQARKIVCLNDVNVYATDTILADTEYNLA